MLIIVVTSETLLSQPEYESEMIKKKKIIRTSRKGKKKGSKPITTTSVAFKTQILDGLKAHELHAKKDLSISWIVNTLSEKLLSGEITIN